MTQEFRYSAFISYSSQDREWAERLYNDLTARGIEAFFDRERLVTGRAWPSQLVESLNESRHLVLLWSDAAQKSNWVQNEVGRFTQIVDPRGKGLTGERGVFSVDLQGRNAALAGTQTISDLAEAGSYPGNPADVPQETWNRVVDRIMSGIESEKGTLPIPILVVTSTLERISAIDPDSGPPGGPTLRMLLEDLEIPLDRFTGSYGATRTDWRPFGSEQTIREILETLRGELNQDIEAASVERGETLLRLRWDFVPEEFWSSADAADRERKRLGGGGAVVVVDPLSFYDDLAVHWYMDYVLDLLNKDAAFILVLSPVSTPRSALALREAIRRLARQVFAHFYQPPAFSGRPYARSGPSVGDPIEFRAWLTAALAGRVAAAKASQPLWLDLG